MDTNLKYFNYRNKLESLKNLNSSNNLGLNQNDSIDLYCF